MILQKEIMTMAEQKGVVKSTIDKDWVLKHFSGNQLVREAISKLLKEIKK